LQWWLVEVAEVVDERSKRRMEEPEARLGRPETFGRPSAPPAYDSFASWRYVSEVDTSTTPPIDDMATTSPARSSAPDMHERCMKKKSEGWAATIC
jgi:hypothetical protein